MGGGLVPIRNATNRITISRMTFLKGVNRKCTGLTYDSYWPVCGESPASVYYFDHCVTTPILSFYNRILITQAFEKKLRILEQSHSNITDDYKTLQTRNQPQTNAPNQNPRLSGISKNEPPSPPIIFRGVCQVVGQRGAYPNASPPASSGTGAASSGSSIGMPVARSGGVTHGQGFI